MVVVFVFTLPIGVFAFVLIVVCFTDGAPTEVVVADVEVVLVDGTTTGTGSGCEVVVEDAWLSSSCTVVSARTGIPTAKQKPTVAAKNF